MLPLITLIALQGAQGPGLEVERRAPFSYFSVSSDELGLKDCPQAFQLTFDGAISSGFKELDIKAGSPLKSIDARIRTPLRGYLPIYTYGFDRDGAHYGVQTFAWTPNLDPRENLIAFERITISNRTAKTAHVNLSASIGSVGQAARVRLSHRQWYTQKFNSAPLQPTLPVEKGG
ncbi:MAG TPA: hypothetical protein VFG65_06540, partial [Fimbriimonadales bacterium]|nr:hypothetical protein [Fimbriimonadales bacterium]